jgi:hypothetical protein
MTNADKLWQDMKDNYLCRVEAALMMTDKASRQNILKDVEEHLDRRYAELTPQQRMREQFEAIIADMGPAEDYAELLVSKPMESRSTAYVPSKGLVFLNRLATVFYVLVLFGAVVLHTGMGTTVGPYQDLQNSWVPPFVNDPNLVGTWISVDFVDRPEDFVPGQKCWKGGDFYLKQMVFHEDGTATRGWCWTKGDIYCRGDKTHSKYFIRRMDNRDYLFFEWMSGDVVILGRAPCYYVLQKEVQK